MSRSRASAGTGNRSLTRTLTVVLLVLAALYFLVPLYWLVISSMKTQGALSTTNGLLPDFSNFALFDNIASLGSVAGGRFGRWVLNSVIYAVGGAAVATLLSILAGYALAVFVFPGRSRLFELVVAGLIMPTTALALPLFLLFSAVGLNDTYWAVLLPSIVNPFGVYLARIYAAEAVPLEVVEAARLDGASELRIFFEIVSRMLTPATVTIFLVQFVHIWNDFFLPRLVLQDSDLDPLTLGLFQLNVLVERNAGMQMSVITGSMLSVMPLVVLFLALQRYWKAGMTAGALR